MKHLKNNKNLHEWLRFSPWLLLAGLLFWFGSLTTFNLGIDQEFALYRTDERVWISQGRWVIFFLTQYIYSQPVISYLPHLLFITLLTFSYVLILDAFAIDPKKKWLALVGAGLFIAHPIWYFIAEFYTNIVPTGLGIFSCSLALWLYSQQEKTTPLGIIAQLALIVFALGSYQAFILAMAAMYFAFLVHLFIKTRLTLKQLLIKVASTVCYLLLALVVNQVFLQLLYKIYDVAPSYVNNLLNTQAIFSDFFAIAHSVSTGGLSLYVGSADLYGSSLVFIGIAFVIGFMVLAVEALKKKKLLMSVALLAASAAIPLSLHGAAAGFWHMPLRATIALPFIAWFIGTYALFNLKNHYAKTAMVVLLCLANLQLLNVHATYSSAKQLTLDYDQRIAGLLFNDITTLLPDYNFKEIQPLSVKGGLSYQSPYGHVPTTAITGSFFWWDGGSAPRISYYLRSIGLPGLEAVTPQQDELLQPYYENMPIWPAHGSIQLHEGALLIRLGE